LPITFHDPIDGGREEAAGEQRGGGGRAGGHACAGGGGRRPGLRRQQGHDEQVPVLLLQRGQRRRVLRPAHERRQLGLPLQELLGQAPVLPQLSQLRQQDQVQVRHQQVVLGDAGSISEPPASSYTGITINTHPGLNCSSMQR